ncbi:MAG: hypothetical protein ABSH41_16460 [Syntrophobacteraceae bacterium]|jgi:putative component of toxin-antitoxin plasmid stabilization module
MSKSFDGEFFDVKFFDVEKSGLKPVITSTCRQNISRRLSRIKGGAVGERSPGARHWSRLRTRSEAGGKSALPGRGGLWRRRYCRRSLLLLGGGDSGKAKDTNKAEAEY